MEKEVYDIDKEIYEMGKEIFNYLKDNFKIYTVEECEKLRDEESAYGFIYMTQCKVNGKLYIGQKKLSKGFRTYLGSGTLFLRAVDKYGKDNFERIILEIAYSKEELDDFEIKYIELFDASEEDLFYNIMLGGNGGVCLKGEEHPLYKERITLKCDYCGEEIKRLESHIKDNKNNFCGKKCADNWKKENLKGENNPMYGKHLSEEARRKISEGREGKYAGENHPLYGKHCSEETKKKICEANRGRHQSEEARRKISEGIRGENHPNYGKHHSEKTLKKMSDCKIGKNNSNAKLVVAIFPDGRVIKDVCIKELAKELGVTEDTARKILRSKKPYKAPNKHLKHLDGIIIMTQEDYSNTLENTNINDDKAS